MTIPDPIADLNTYISDDADVSELTDRVFSGGLPQAAEASMPESTVVIKPAGGPGRQKLMLTRVIVVDTICYGAMLIDAWQLHLAVREALETLARPVGSVKSVEMVSEAALAIDQTTQWPTCYASYHVLTTIHT